MFETEQTEPFVEKFGLFEYNTLKKLLEIEKHFLPTSGDFPRLKINFLGV